MNLDAEFDAARDRIYRRIVEFIASRVAYFNRSRGQRIRRQRERANRVAQ